MLGVFGHCVLRLTSYEKLNASSRRVEVRIAESSGHLIPMDNDWKEVAGWIEEFIHEAGPSIP